MRSALGVNPVHTFVQLCFQFRVIAWDEIANGNASYEADDGDKDFHAGHYTTRHKS